ncbi:porin family protein [Fulvimarina endophytica]|uniref:Porin family protein n=1 Tax=Fulvimarina endophytica TaxID=2293836 RepID=A0A371X047_9HYPH|nr:outer membrane beta-barrel protein [Fulvimarina endophytica]RFC62611.1 porin family protein [Fulvimarina endophytica]
MRRLLLSSAALSMLTVPSLAADVVYEEQMMAPAPMMIEPVASGWTGLYVGVQGGGAFNPSNPDNVTLQTNGFALNRAGVVGTNAGNPTGSLGGAFGRNYESSFDSSFVGGAHIGYDYQIDQFVIGAVADFNAIDVSRNSTADSSTPAFYRTERNLDFLGTVRARAGYLVTPSTLAYATGGLAYGNVDYNFSSDSPAITAANPAIVREDEDDVGYAVGGGMEVMFTDNMSFGAEYLYVNLGGGGSTRLAGGPFAGGVGGSTDFVVDDDFDFHTVTAKISYKFK